MAGRKKEETTLMEREAWRLRTERGLTHEAITEELNRRYFIDRPYHRSSISKALTRTAKRYLADRDDYIQQYKVEHTEVLEKVVSDLLEALEKSKESTKKAVKTTRSIPGKEGESKWEETRLETEDQYIDVNLVKTLQSVLSDIRDIWGANAPVETVQTIRGGLLTGQKEVAELSDSELLAIITGQS